MRNQRTVLAKLRKKLTRQMLARQHSTRPMNQQVVEKILARHGR